MLSNFSNSHSDCWSEPMNNYINKKCHHVMLRHMQHSTSSLGVYSVTENSGLTHHMWSSHIMSCKNQMDKPSKWWSKSRRHWCQATDSTWHCVCRTAPATNPEELACRSALHASRALFPAPTCDHHTHQHCLLSPQPLHKHNDTVLLSHKKSIKLFLSIQHVWQPLDVTPQRPAPLHSAWVYDITWIFSMSKLSTG